MTAHLLDAPFQAADPDYLESDALTDLNKVVAVIRELLGGDGSSSLTISAGGAVVPTQAQHTLLPASGTADELTNVTATNHPTGRLLLLRPNTNGHTITCTSNAGGTNPLRLVNNLPFVMTTADHLLLLYLRGNGSWYEALRSYGDDLAAYRAFLGAAYATTSTPGLIQIATPSQLRAGVNDLIAMTPKHWSDASGANGNGTFWRQPGNRITQMGTVTASATVDSTVTLPIPMANATYWIQATPMTGGNIGGVPPARLVHTWGRTTTDFQLSCWTPAGARAAVQISWEVKGFEPAP